MSFFRRRRQFTHGPPTVTYLGAAANIAFIGTARVAYRGFTGTGQGNLGPINKNKVIVGIIQQGNAAIPVAAFINGVNAPVYGVTSAAPGIGVFSALVPYDGSSPVFDIRYNSNPTGSPGLVLWSIVGLSSPVPRSVVSSALAGADTTRTVDLDTEVGGIAVMVAANNITAAQACTLSGDQTPTENDEVTSGTGRVSIGMIQGTNSDSANTITATFDVISTTAIGLLAAAFR